MKTVLVTGSSGLIGSAAVEHFDRQGCTVVGVDNNMRRTFFGPAGDTRWNLRRLKARTKRFIPVATDIRDVRRVARLFREHRFDLIVHCAAQPSHDLASSMPQVDFEVNAVGTMNLLEATRRHCPDAVFAHMSTNKVYGDAPNERPLVERPTRYDYARPEDAAGINEGCRMDRSLHSIFGASKAAADLMAQEYGRSFGLRVGIFRCGCVTGPAHAGVELHGFLSYLVKVAVQGGPYTVYGYKGKQVRDQIHSADVIQAVETFARDPEPGEPYNMGGGRANSLSVLEAIQAVERLAGVRLAWRYEDRARRGDHICYMSDLTKFRTRYPGWTPAYPLTRILGELVEAERARTRRGSRRRRVAVPA